MSGAGVILLTFLAQAHARQVPAHRTDASQYFTYNLNLVDLSSLDKLVDKLVDRLADRLLDGTMKASSLQRTPGHGAMVPRTSLRPSHHAEHSQSKLPASFSNSYPMEVKSTSGRRDLFGLFQKVAATTILWPWTAHPVLADPSEDYKTYKDPLKGFSLSYPSSWSRVITAGQDFYPAFYRNPISVEEILFVQVTSKNKVERIEDLGDAKKTASRYRKIYKDEVQGTRLGVRREAEVLSATTRTGPGDKTYYDFTIGIQSYAAQFGTQLSVNPDGRVPELEWDRRYYTTVGVTNGTIYELRIQTPAENSKLSQEAIGVIRSSFECKQITQGVLVGSALKGAKNAGSENIPLAPVR